MANSKQTKHPAHAAPAESTRGAGIASNGMHRFAMHTQALKNARVRAAIAAKPDGPQGRRGAAAPTPAAQDPETAAFGYLKRALASTDLPEFSDPLGGDHPISEFQRLGTETVPLTNTRTVKFRQTVNKVPIYGSLVTVELDENNQCLAINSSLGAPKSLSPVAKISPLQALAVAAGAAGEKVDALKATPRLHYYFDKSKQGWALVYIVENIPKRARSERAYGHAQAAVFDYVVNANTGKLIAELPRTASAALQETAVDALGIQRTFTVESSSSTRILRNGELNITTHAFQYRDPTVESGKLPGSLVRRTPPKAWPPGAVSAHANAEIVGIYLRDVLVRNGIDNAGGPMVSTIDCVVHDESDTPKQWTNAYWDPDIKQMIYGQRVRDGGRPPLSIAAMLDIVAHEMFHGVTDGTARLEYAGQSGAMNESYSDIFGVLVQNATVADRSKWKWQVGVGFDADGKPLRDIKSPEDFGQPRHMNNYLQTPSKPSEANDWGGVHTNSGIHNHVAYRMMVAPAGKTSRCLFTKYCFGRAVISRTTFYNRMAHFKASVDAFAAAMLLKWSMCIEMAPSQGHAT
ncbi:M4 family metallopeptidase [Cupriavidus basilensis]|uniref:M4 family metallopeptidase n=1 Tax=Cupriavidus basilensis TaxID=68895 RepID=UPI0023E8C9E8|nr:M4 family metallopeptidase [Cupriavidus basilensis]MDF3886692.1 M4 family metallopeptidase [Cupriavidus basilensis]